MSFCMVIEIEFNGNRPFFYALINSKHATLFSGRITNFTDKQ